MVMPVTRAFRFCASQMLEPPTPHPASSTRVPGPIPARSARNAFVLSRLSLRLAVFSSAMPQCNARDSPAQFAR